MNVEAVNQSKMSQYLLLRIKVKIKKKLEFWKAHVWYCKHNFPIHKKAFFHNSSNGDINKNNFKNYHKGKVSLFGT